MNLKRFYQVDSDIRRRAQFATLAAKLEAHAEPFDSIEELLMFATVDGVLFVDDSGGAADEIFAAFDETARWLPVVAYCEGASAPRAVDVLHMGAIDYLAWPIFPDFLAARLKTAAQRSAHLMLAQRRRERAVRAVERLSDREAEVLSLIGQGHSNKSVAWRLGISPRTVEVHRANMMGKIGARCAAEAILYAVEAGLVHREAASAGISGPARRES